MAYEFKKLSDVNILEEKKTGLNVLVEDAGEIVKISNDDLNPANSYMVVDTTYHYGKEEGSINPYFQDPISTVVSKFQGVFNKTNLARGILTSSGMTTYNSIGEEIIRQDDGTFDAIVYYNDLHPLYLSSSKNTITLLEGWEEPAPSIPAPATAEVGQTIVVKSIDENGKPTEWEAVDMGGSSGSVTNWDDLGLGEIVRAEFVPESTVAFEQNGDSSYGYAYIEVAMPAPFAEGEMYCVIFDGVEYECNAYTLSAWSTVCIGNATLVGESGGNGEPFFVAGFNNAIDATVKEAGEHTIKIVGELQEYNRVPAEYLPDSATNVYIAETYDGSVLATSYDELKGAIQSGKRVYLYGALGTGNYAEFCATVGGEGYPLFKGVHSGYSQLGTDIKNIILQPVYCMVASDGTISHRYPNTIRFNYDDKNRYSYADITADSDGGLYVSTNKNKTPKAVMVNGDKEIILNSSTVGSAKKFKITVDDSGTLTATEVTE